MGSRRPMGLKSSERALRSTENSPQVLPYKGSLCPPAPEIVPRWPGGARPQGGRRGPPLWTPTRPASLDSYQGRGPPSGAVSEAELIRAPCKEDVLVIQGSDAGRIGASRGRIGASTGRRCDKKLIDKKS